MSVGRIRRDVQNALKNDGKVDSNELDQIALEARSDGKIDANEKAELQKLAGKSNVDQGRLSEHLNAIKEDAFVGASVKGTLKGIDHRYAVLSTTVPGLSAKVGLFDNVVGIEGQAKQAGRLEVFIEGRHLVTDVKPGEKSAAVLERIQAQLPEGVRGRVFGGTINTADAAKFEGVTPRQTEKTAHLAMFRPQSLTLRPGEKPLRVVITGYGPFPGVEKNPSGELAKQLSAMGIRGARVEYQVLPVTHEDVDAFVKKMKENPPDVVLSMGVAPFSQVEPRGQNWKSAYPDANGNTVAEGKIEVNGGEDLPTGLPQDEIGRRLQETFGTASTVNSHTQSPDDSAYLCNYMNYRLLESFPKGSGTSAGFVHVTDHTTAEEMQTVVEAAVARRLEQRRAAESGPTPPTS